MSQATAFSLPRRPLGRAGFDVTALTLGGAGLGGLYGPVPEEAAVHTVVRAIELGINYMEGAPFYGDCESRYAKALARLGGRPAGLRICSKVGMHPERYGDYSAAATRWSLEGSLKILGLESVDMVQVHATEAIDMAAVLGPDGAVAELERMREEGKVGAIAFAIRGADYHRQAIASGRFDAILIHDDFSLIRRSDERVIAEAAAAGMGVLVGRALMTGLLAGPDPGANPRLAAHADAPAAMDWWRWARERELPLQAVAVQFAMRHPGGEQRRDRRQHPPGDRGKRRRRHLPAPPGHLGRGRGTHAAGGMSAPGKQKAAGLPSGTATFLFTDVEGSTRLLDQYPEAYAAAMVRHHAILGQAVEARGGHVFETLGDAVYAVFPDAADAIAAAVDGQRQLQAADWGPLGTLTVRMGVHTGEVERQGDHYFGAPLYRCARLTNTAHGEQIVVSAATATLVRGCLPPGAALLDLGEHRLKDLQRPERIFQLTASGLAADFPPLRALGERRHNLPVAPTAFIGREHEIAALRDLLRRPHTRLVSLTGPGGVGKTRLSLQTAADLLDDYRDGVFFVELAPLPSPELVIPTLAKALGLREPPNRPLFEVVREYLADKEALLVLDNFEHLLPAAPQVADLLAGCPRVKALVTSRAILHLDCEQQMGVPPLSLPDSACPGSADDLTRSEAIQLFVERARSIRLGFAIGPANACAVAEICRRLDGLPLAIELAAARVKILPPAEILALMREPMAVLTGGPRNLPPRQQTLRQTIAWSHDLLGAEEQCLFRRLAVFAGGCTLRAAETVAAADALTGLASLVDNSLLQRSERDEGDEPRFAMLETLREYALERLDAAGETPALRARHADWYLALAEQAEPGLIGAPQAIWLGRLQQDYDNLRAALRWRVDHGPAGHGLRLAAALGRFWRAHGYIGEVRGQLATLLAQATSEGPARAKALHVASWLAREQADYDEARTLAGESLALYRALAAPRGIGWALIDLAFVARYQADYGRTRALLEESLPPLREADDREGIAVALGNLGFIARDEGNGAVAEAHLQASLALWQKLADPIGTGWTLTALGIVARSDGRRELARARLDQALGVWREIGDRQNQANVLGTLAALARDTGDWDRAATLLGESLAILREVGDRRAIAFVLEGFAGLAAARGEASRALTLAAAAGAARSAIGAPAPPAWATELEATLKAAGAALPAEAAAEAARRGQALDLPDAIAYALQPAPH